LRKWPSGRREHFKRAQNALPVRRPQPRGCARIARLKARVQFVNLHTFGVAAHLRAYFGGHRWNIGEALRQPAKIETRPADEDRQSPLRPRLIERIRSIDGPASRRIILRGVHMTIKSMRRLPLFVGRGPCRNDAQVVIDLHRIGIDDRPADLPGERKCERGLAARRRTCNEQGTDHQELLVIFISCLTSPL
jgi:hypothetical protein